MNKFKLILSIFILNLVIPFNILPANVDPTNSILDAYKTAGFLGGGLAGAVITDALHTPIHESGHFLAARAFNCKNVKMFIGPENSAALFENRHLKVSSLIPQGGSTSYFRPQNLSNFKRIIIHAAGPLKGIGFNHILWMSALSRSHNQENTAFQQGLCWGIAYRALSNIALEFRYNLYPNGSSNNDGHQIVEILFAEKHYKYSKAAIVLASAGMAYQYLKTTMNQLYF